MSASDWSVRHNPKWLPIHKLGHWRGVLLLGCHSSIHLRQRWHVAALSAGRYLTVGVIATFSRCGRAVTIRISVEVHEGRVPGEIPFLASVGAAPHPPAGTFSPYRHGEKKLVIAHAIRKEKRPPHRPLRAATSPQRGEEWRRALRLATPPGGFAATALRYGSGRSSLEKTNRWLFAAFGDRSSPPQGGGKSRASCRSSSALR